MDLRTELSTWSQEKLVDSLINYMTADQARKDKINKWGKNWREKNKAELAEFRLYKQQK